MQTIAGILAIHKLETLVLPSVHIIVNWILLRKATYAFVIRGQYDSDS